MSGSPSGIEADGGPAGAPAGPALQQLRPGGGQHQDGRRAGVPVGQALHEVEQGVVGPVQVLQGQDQRPGRGQAVQEAPPGGELLLAVGGGGRAGAARAATADADQAAEVAGDPGGGDRLGHGRGGRDQAPAGELGAVALQDAGLGLDRLGKGPEGRAVAVGQGPALAPGDPRGRRPRAGQPVGQLGQEPALADAGVADDGDQLGPGAVAGAGGGGRQRLQLAVAGHQRREAPAGGGRPGPGRERRPRGHRVAGARRGRAGRAVGDRPLGGPPGRLRHQHGPGRGQLLEPGGGSQRLAGDPRATLVASRPDQHLPGGHRRQHPHRRRPGRQGSPSLAPGARASRMARAARTARSGSSSRVRGTPNRATVRPPSVSVTTPPWASTSARTRASGPESSRPASSGSRSAKLSRASSTSISRTVTSLRSAPPGGSGGEGRDNRRSLRVLRTVRAGALSLAPPGTGT